MDIDDAASPGGPTATSRWSLEVVGIVVVEQRFHVEDSRADVKPMTARDGWTGQPFVCPTPCRAEATPDTGCRLSMDLVQPSCCAVVRRAGKELPCGHEGERSVDVECSSVSPYQRLCIALAGGISTKLILAMLARTC